VIGNARPWKEIAKIVRIAKQSKLKEPALNLRKDRAASGAVAQFGFFGNFRRLWQFPRVLCSALKVLLPLFLDALA
jgi:hypothetical protein